MAVIKTPKFRVSYPKVFKPELNKLSKKMEYSLVALFANGQDLTAMYAAAEEALKEEFGENKAKWPKNLKNPFKKQEDRADVETGVLPSGHEAGAIYMNLKSSQKPGLVDQQVQHITDESSFYAGCWAIASVNCKAYNFEDGVSTGVAFYLNNIQKVADGEPLSPRPSPEADFAPIAGAVAANGAAKPKTANDLFA